MDNENAVGFSNQTFQIWLATPQKQRVKRKSPVGEEFIVADHLAILVQDRKTVDAANKEMEKNGFKALFPCEEHPEFCPGYYAVSFCDPDNCVIEVYTRPIDGTLKA
jgi:predicted transcriptional regulator of viral defense system